jgi:hypothetical protein
MASAATCSCHLPLFRALSTAAPVHVGKKNTIRPKSDDWGSCLGDGTCMTECQCTCLICSCGDPDSHHITKCSCPRDGCLCHALIRAHMCTCGHRAHNGYCPPPEPCPHGCRGLPCPNDIHHAPGDRGALYPRWVLSSLRGVCPKCARGSFRRPTGGPGRRDI